MNQPPAARPSASSQPLDLPRLVMRRAASVALVVLLMAVVLGLARMNDDIEDEVAAAMTLAGMVARLASLAQTDDGAALAALRDQQAEHPLRHLVLRVQAADGRLLLAPQAATDPAGPMRALLALHRAWWPGPEGRGVAWQVPRATGGPWTVSLTASHESERREAMGSLLGMLLLLLVGVAALLTVMRWNMRQAFAPLGRLVDAIGRIEGQHVGEVQTLPVMPIRELEAVAAALRHLGAALDVAQAQRRLLSQQVLTLQEDERGRLARDLHDEFGQRLTALRVDAAWLARQLAYQPALKAVVDGMSQQCERVQHDIRDLLTRLQPFGPAAADAADGESLAHGVALLRSLVDSWQGGARDVGTACRLDLAWQAADGSVRPWPVDHVDDTLWLPRSLLLALYRISQEALTNVARHAQARQAVLRLQGSGGLNPGEPVRIDWSVVDDGVGLPSEGTVAPRGNGLAGIQERVWAQGGTLHWASAQPGAACPGLRLHAHFDSRWLPSPTPATLA